MGFVYATGEVVDLSSSSTGASSSSGSGDGTGASFVCSGMCAVATASNTANQTLTLGTTGEAWYVLTKLPVGWQGSEMAGRTIDVNGIRVALGGGLPAAAKDGKWYFRFSAGSHSWASWSWWS